MKIKKVTADTMPEAMKIVRKELGRDAVILNSREVRSKGFLGLFRKRRTEVIAALDPIPYERSTKQPTPSTQGQTQGTSSMPSTSSDQSRMDQRILEELKDLRENMKQQSTQTIYNAFPEPIQRVCEHLEDQEIQDPYIQDIANYLLEKYFSQDRRLNERELLDEAKLYLLNKTKHSGAEDNMFDKQFIFFFGPTGVGKTTTIAKIAANLLINYNKKVAFITLDTYRIAAIEQLKTYAKILNIPIEVAYNKDELAEAREQFADFDYVFIDTAGRNYRKDEYIDQMKDFVQFDEEDEVFCVLSLTMKPKDIEDVYEQFSLLPVQHVIFTKADETTQYGSMLNLTYKHGIRVAYITNGQNVPDDIEPATPQLLVDMMVGDTND